MLVKGRTAIINTAYSELHRLSVTVSHGVRASPAVASCRSAKSMTGFFNERLGRSDVVPQENGRICDQATDRRTHNWGGTLVHAGGSTAVLRNV